jgi:hypothetical protein
MNMRRRGNAHLQNLRGHAAVSLLFAAALAFTVPAMRAEYAKETKVSEPWRAEVNGPFDSKIRLEMYERVRGEFADWFGNPIVGGSVVPKEYRYNFVGNKFQLGLGLWRRGWLPALATLGAPVDARRHQQRLGGPGS